MTKNTSLSPNPTGFDDFVYTYLEAKMAKSMTNVPLPTAANMTERAFRSCALRKVKVLVANSKFSKLFSESNASQKVERREVR